MKKYYVDDGAHFSTHDVFAHVFSHGTEKDAENLKKTLKSRFSGETVVLTKNGRSAITLALKTLYSVKKSSAGHPRTVESTIPAPKTTTKSSDLAKKSQNRPKVIVNAFTCYAVVEAVRAAGFEPIYADISLVDLNFTIDSVKKVYDNSCVAIILQYTFGNPSWDAKEIINFAHEKNLVIISDLAHGFFGRPTFLSSKTKPYVELGDAACLSFGKDKAIDATSGGAVIFKEKSSCPVPEKKPKFADFYRSKFYPLFALQFRTLPSPLNKLFMAFLLKTHQIERSADNRLDLSRRPSYLECKNALRELKRPKPRTYVLVKDRKKCLKKVKKFGFRGDHPWYDPPISPERYYKKANFSAKDCPVACFAAKTVINFLPLNSETDKSFGKIFAVFEKYSISLADRAIITQKLSSGVKSLETLKKVYKL